MSASVIQSGEYLLEIDTGWDSFKLPAGLSDQGSARQHDLQARTDDRVR
jgi:hypothetical protein